MPSERFEMTRVSEERVHTLQIQFEYFADFFFFLFSSDEKQNLNWAHTHFTNAVDCCPSEEKHHVMISIAPQVSISIWSAGIIQTMPAFNHKTE